MFHSEIQPMSDPFGGLNKKGRRENQSTVPSRPPSPKKKPLLHRYIIEKLSAATGPSQSSTGLYFRVCVKLSSFRFSRKRKTERRVRLMSRMGSTNTNSGTHTHSYHTYRVFLNPLNKNISARYHIRKKNCNDTPLVSAEVIAQAPLSRGLRGGA